MYVGQHLGHTSVLISCIVRHVPLVRVDPQRMRLARERLALTQLELAKHAGLGYATVSQLERGLVRPRMPTLRKLAKALGVKPADLLEDTSRS